jgi:hypothetical protein
MTLQRKFSRTFQIWSYTVSHGQLLLRSTKTPAQPTRIDVLFKDVTMMKLMAELHDLSIREVAAEDVGLDVGIRPGDDQRVFGLSSKNFGGFVVAGTVVVHEDDKEYYEPSAISPT